MRKALGYVFVPVCIVLVVTLAVVIRTGLAQSSPQGGDPQVTPGPGMTLDQSPNGYRLNSVSPNLISNYASNPYCYQPDASQNACYINWRSAGLSATAPDYAGYLVISIDSKPVLRMTSFFEDNLYYDQTISSPGFRVSCGQLNSGGLAGWGAYHQLSLNFYSYTDVSQGADYATVYCPPYTP